MDLIADMFDPAVESAVLACCLQSDLARKRARSVISGPDFWLPKNEAIWDAMERLDRQGKTVDPVSVGSVLRAQAPDDKTSGLYGLVRASLEMLPHLLTYPVVADSVEQHAEQVRAFAVRRRLLDEVRRAEQSILNPAADVLGMSASIATRFAGVRDAGVTGDIEAMTVEELMLEVDDEPDWLIPDFLERSDRFILTGEEGLGKSHLLRQVAILGSAGLDPFRPWKQIPPVKGMVIDFENSRRQVRRRLWRTYEYAVAKGQGQPGLATVLCMPRSDITTDRVLARIHRELDACQPEILVIGPLYRMSPKALQTDDEAGPVLAALDTIRDRGIALLIEAHAGHVKSHGNTRDLRPRGSSALLGWPEFGYGMKRIGEKSAGLVPWRGDRDLRDFPTRLVETEGRWEEERPRLVWDYHDQERQDWSDLDEYAEGDQST